MNTILWVILAIVSIFGAIWEYRTWGDLDERLEDLEVHFHNQQLDELKKLD